MGSGWEAGGGDDFDEWVGNAVKVNEVNRWLCRVD